MHKILPIVAIAAMLGLVACSNDKTKTDDSKQAETSMNMEHSTDMMAEQVVYYACPMKEHSHAASKEPGTCDECGMALVPVVKGTADDHDFYGCPMPKHSHVRSDESGTCPECGMKLEPLKFKM